MRGTTCGVFLKGSTNETGDYDHCGVEVWSWSGMSIHSSSRLFKSARKQRLRVRKVRFVIARVFSPYHRK